MIRFAGGCLLLSAFLACGTPTAPEVAGAWGGPQASLTLSSAGGTIQYQCGNGTIDAGWSVSAGGVFEGTGTHFFGGGPVPPGGREPHPARYTGRIDGARFTLTVTITDLAETLGPLVLLRDGPTVTEICV